MGTLLAERLAAAQRGELTLANLREAFDTELKAMQEADAAISSKDGWRAATMLDGDDFQAKSTDFEQRTRALGGANVWLRDQYAARDVLTKMSELPPADDVAAHAGAPIEQKQFYQLPGTGQQISIPAAPRGMQGQETLVLGMPDEGISYKAFTESAEYKQFVAMPHERRVAMLRTPGTLLSEIDPKVMIPVLKAYTFSTGTAGLLASDRMGMPYQLMTHELQYFPMVSEQNSVVRYFESESPSIASATGAARGRARGGTINEVSVASDAVVRPKKSIGIYAEIPEEDLNDNAMISERVNRQLDIHIRSELARNIINGSGSGTEWNGVMSRLTSAASNITGITLTHNAVPVVAAQEKEPVAFFEILLGHLALRGNYPSVIFLGANDWGKVRQSQRNLRNQAEDYMRFPYGQILGVPMQLSHYVGENQALMVDTSSVTAVLGDGIKTGVSNDYAFRDNSIALKRTAYGNVEHLMPLGAFKVTATNLFAAATQ